MLLDFFGVIAVLLFGFIFLDPVFSAPDQELTYHGKLTDNLGLAVPDGNYDFTLTIYDAASGGTCLWTTRGICGTPSPKILSVKNGIFSTLLGESGDNPLTLAFDTNYYLEIQINGNQPMSPRRKVTPTGFALNAHRLNGKTADNYIDTSNIAQAKQGALAVNGNFTVNTNTFVVDVNTGKIGIGDTTPDHTLDVNGNIGLTASSYINFGDTDGSTGYGLRDNAGVLEFKDDAGTWKTLSSSSMMAIGNSITSATQGSLLFAGVSGNLAQDNANLFWDDTNKRLGVGTNTPAHKLDVSGNQRVAGNSDYTQAITSSYDLLLQTTPSNRKLYFAGNGNGYSIQSMEALTAGVNLPLSLNPNGGNVGIKNTNPTSSLSVGTATSGGNIYVGSSDATSEGAQIDLEGAGAYDSWSFDLYANNPRLFTGSANNNTFQLFNASTGIANLSVEGNVEAAGGLTQDGSVILNGSDTWLRTTGSTGWYSTTYGGGMYMTDGTFVRTYNSKPLAANAYYDQDDTNFYVNPSGTSILNDIRPSIVYDRNDTNFYVDPNGTSVLNASYQSYIYDREDAGFYLDLNNTTKMNQLWTDIMYDRNDTGYYLNPNGGSNMYSLNVNAGVTGKLAGDFAQFRAWADNYSFLIRNDNGQSYFLLTNNGDPNGYWNALRPIVVNNASGYVGIGGAIIPSYQLHVIGTAYATGAAGALSDVRHKHDIADIENGLETILKLRPVSYAWNDPVDDGMKGRQMGFIAQEVEAIAPSIVLTQNDEEQTRGLKYNEFLPLAVSAIQQQNVLIQTNTSSLTTKASALSVAELQVVANAQFTQTEKNLTTIQGNMLVLQQNVNEQADMLSDIQVDLDSMQSGISILTTLNATDAMKFADLLAIDPEKIVVADEDGDVTIPGITTVDLLVARKVQTEKVIISEDVTTTDNDDQEINAASVGTAVIKSGEKQVAVHTDAVQKGDRVFVTVRDASEAVSVQVKSVEDGGQFIIDINKEMAEDIIVDWFVVGVK